MAIGGYMAYVYSTTSGRIVGPAELPLADVPTWNRQVNNAGAWSVKMPFGSTWSQTAIRSVSAPMRFSVAIFWGTYCVQAGPITGYSADDDSGTWTLSGGGLWTLFNKRLLHNPAWNPASVAITDVSADTTLTGQTWDIAAQMVTNSTTWVNRPGSSLPLDIPAQSGTGTATRTYYGYDLAYCGQRLQELTQSDGGPDIDFAPYKVSGSNLIRHRMVVGQPYITQTGAPVIFDYGTSLQKLPIDSDGSNVATTAWVKGTGSERVQLFGTATATGLTTNGWPATDYVDTNHASTTDPVALGSYATADLALYGRSIESWKAVIRTDGNCPLGTYAPGFFATYNLNGHPFQPDGQYLVRILGIGNGPDGDTVVHALDGRGGF